MATKSWIGNAAAQAQIQTYNPGSQPPNTTLTATINGKSVSYLSASGSNDDLVQGLMGAWSGSKIAEFGEITARAGVFSPAVGSPNSTYLQLSSKTPGTPFTVTFSISQPAQAQVTRSVAGSAGQNELQKIVISPNAQSGSFTATWGGNTTNPIPLPPQPLTGSQGSAGNIAAGTYQYVMTYTTADGETEQSFPFSITLSAGVQCNLSSIHVGPANVTNRIIYRTKAGGSTFYYLTTIAGNSTTTYTDNFADSSLGLSSPPPTNYCLEGAIAGLSGAGDGNIKVSGAVVNSITALPYTGDSALPALVAAADSTAATIYLGPNPITYEVEFTGSLANASQSLISVDTGGLAVLPVPTIEELVAGYPIQNEKQTVGFKQVYGLLPATGTFKISLPVLGVTTGPLVANVGASTVLSAIQAVVPAAYANSFAVTSASATTSSYLFTIEYKGLLAAREIPQATVDSSSLIPAPGDVVTPYWDTTQPGSATGQDEQITLTINNAPTSGTFNVTIYDGLTGVKLAASQNMAYNATASQVEAAFAPAGTSLPYCKVSGGTGGPYTVVFQGDLGARFLRFAWTSSLVGSGPPPGSPPGSNSTGISPPIQTDGIAQTSGGALATNTYYYVITATTSSGETTASNEKSFAVTGPSGYVILNWNLVSGASGYKIYRGTSSGGENVLVATVPASVLGTVGNFHDPGETSVAASPPGSNTAGISVPTLNFQGLGSGGLLSSGTPYYYKVTAFNGSGETTGSNEVTYTLPTGFSRIEVQWGEVSGATGYKLYRGTSSGSENVLIATVNTSATGSALNIVDNGSTGTSSSPPGSDTSGISAPVQNNTTPSSSGGSLASATYYYEITATNGTGETTASNEKSAVVTGPTGSVALSWNAVSGASGYKIYRGTSSGGENVIVATIASGATVTYTDTGASNGAASSVTRVDTALASANEVQLITLSGATSGTFRLSSNGSLTDTILYNDSAANVQSDLEAILGSGNVSVTGSAGGPYAVTFQGELADSPQPKLGVLGTGLGGTLTIAGSPTTTQSATGPNHWDNAQNWSPLGVPVTGDNVYFQNTTVPVYFGLDQSGVVLAGLNVDMSYIGGQIGLPNVNKTGKYSEYRPQYLQIGVSGKIYIGNGNGGGPTLVKLDTGANATNMEINGTGNRSDPSLPVVIWKGNRSGLTGGLTDITVNKGYFGAAMFAGETATIDILRQGYKDNPRSDSDVFLGAGTTVTTWYMDGGNGTLNGSISTLTVKQGTMTAKDGLTPAAITNLSLLGGTFYHFGTGLVSLADVGTGAVYDRSQETQSVHMGTVNLYGKSSFLDPHGVVVFNTPITFVNCGVEDVTLELGKNITIQRTAL